jgi:hypothetical protein
VSEGAWPWVVLAAVGAFHGLNPAMGWLFAVALGLQEEDEHAVRRALIPIALGHAASIGLVVFLFGALSLLISPDTLRYAAAGALLVFGLVLLIRVKHPRWVGNRVGFRDLTAWSFLMSTAHGAGLMLVPALLGISAAASAGSYIGRAHAMEAGIVTSSIAAAASAVALHTGAMLVVAGAIATMVYRWFGLRFLRKGWINVNVLWAISLLAAGYVMLIV